jgi:hypothetical protein
MAFSSLALNLAELECGLLFSDEQKDDFIAFWRALGYALGIDDQFNICTSRARADRVLWELLSIGEFLSSGLSDAGLILVSVVFFFCFLSVHSEGSRREVPLLLSADIRLHHHNIFWP